MIFGQLISALAALIFGKLLAVFFTPEVYGTYNLQFATYTFCFGIFLSPLLQFMKRNTNKLNIKIGFSYYIPLLIILCLATILAFLAVIQFTQINISINIYIALTVFLIINTLNLVTLDYLNVIGKIRVLTFTTASQQVLNTIVLLLLVLTMINNESEIIWLSMIASSAIASVVGICNYKTPYKTYFKIAYKKFIHEYLKYAWPLIFMSVWGWINNYFDRFAIEYYLDLKSVGLYNASYGLGAKLFLVLSPIFVTLLIPKIYKTTKLANKKIDIKNSSVLYYIIGIFIIIIVYFTYPLIGRLFLTEEYNIGFYVIPGIAFAYLLLTASYLYEILFYAENKTNYILYSNILSAVVNVVLNIYLIPLYGITGAMVATIMAFAIKLIITIYLFKKM